MYKSINQRIAMYRKMANLTQTEVAEKMGMKCSTYSQMERKGSISSERLLALAEILGVTPEMLLYDPTDNKKLDFSGTEKAASTLSQNNNPFGDSSYGPAPFITTHKEERIIKIIRNLPKPQYDEVIDFINSKYKESKIK
ncbi:MAG: helix-turn-helix domain-containing protein [Acutalibacteraceae bacterium]|nr:helix-turn-helix domain-containing protein [Acutalibacteraceae bacterium]